MSRRKRLEEERNQQLKQDLQEERDKLKLQKERIYAPLTWRRLPGNIRIQDVKPGNYNEILKLLRAHYYTVNLLTRNLEIYEDEPSLVSFEKYLTGLLKDSTSIIAVDEIRQDKIVGVNICSVIYQADYTSVFLRVLPKDGQNYIRLAELMNFLIRRVNVFEEMQCDKFLRIHISCVHRGFLAHNLEAHLLESIFDVARSMRVPAVTMICPTVAHQKLLKKYGFRELYELNYIEYKDKRTNQMVIHDPGPGNYSVILMSALIPDSTDSTTEIDILPPEKDKKEEEEEQEAVKLTRVEKRALKVKNAYRENKK